MALRIRTLGDPVLREVSHALESVDSEVTDLIEAMTETLAESPGRVGLAATQVGVLKRLFVYDLGFGPRCLINPEIVAGFGTQVSEEGCLSLPGISVEVGRHETVRARCLTPTGREIEIEASGFPARVLQHECDHLDGVLIIDRCDSAERQRALEEYQELELQRSLPGA